MSVQKVEITPFIQQDESCTDCYLNIRGADITFEYRWQDDLYVFTGFECSDAPGRYELSCAKRDSSITLYRLAGTDRVIGPWSECVNGVTASGFWDIEIVESDGPD